MKVINVYGPPSLADSWQGPVSAGIRLAKTRKASQWSLTVGACWWPGGRSAASPSPPPPCPALHASLGKHTPPFTTSLPVLAGIGVQNRVPLLCLQAAQPFLSVPTVLLKILEGAHMPSRILVVYIALPGALTPLTLILTRVVWQVAQSLPRVNKGSAGGIGAPGAVAHLHGRGGPPHGHARRPPCPPPLFAMPVFFWRDRLIGGPESTPR